MTADTRPDEAAPEGGFGGSAAPAAPGSAPVASTPAPAAPATPRPGTPAPATERQGATAPSTGPRARVRLTVPRRTVLARGGRLRLRVGLDRAGTVRVQLAVKAGSRRLVALTRTARFARAGTRTVSFALSRTARARLRARRALRLEIALTARDRAGTERRSRTVRGLR